MRFRYNLFCVKSTSFESKSNRGRGAHDTRRALDSDIDPEDMHTYVIESSCEKFVYGARAGAHANDLTYMYTYACARARILNWPRRRVYGIAYHA